MFNNKKSKAMMVGGKCSGGEWKINKERMENVEVFKYLEMREKTEKWDQVLAV